VISVLDIFKIGIGPSSSHTVGPMRAARTFLLALRDAGRLADVTSVRVELHGSLGLTGKGHGTDTAVVLGLLGEEPDKVDVDAAPGLVAEVGRTKRIALLGTREIPFDPREQVAFLRRSSLPLHPNGMRFVARDEAGAVVREWTAYSIGGGFVVDADAVGRPPAEDVAVPHPFLSGAELLARCDATGMSISSLVLANETARRPEAEVRAALLERWRVMQACIARGCEREGILPGGLKVPRRAAHLARRLKARGADDPLSALDWVNLWALAVNEENAASGRVVTAPTNGAAGILPAVLSYQQRFLGRPDDDAVVRFLLTAGAIALLFQHNASLSGAEVGCQGEVGVACSMAAAGLAEVSGGTPAQVENAAEIGMEHNLGLTCDPIGGLVQVPCIERNAMGAVKAINAARLALQGDGRHKVSLDRVIVTMRQTGADMKDKYKETARGGLAVNVPEC
jgi:L-serine dehydratase